MMDEHATGTSIKECRIRIMALTRTTLKEIFFDKISTRAHKTTRQKALTLY